jgi:hypothetical protein
LGESSIADHFSASCAVTDYGERHHINIFQVVGAGTLDPGLKFAR